MTYKYLLPYKDESEIWGYEKYVRYSCFVENNVSRPEYYVFRIHYSRWLIGNLDKGSFGNLDKGSFNSKEDAMKTLDSSLTAQGFIIIPDDQVERFTKRLALLI